MIAAAVAALLLISDWLPALALGLVLQGIARSSMMTIAILTLVETPGVGEARAARASGLFFSAAEVGGAGGLFVLGLLFDATGDFTAGLLCLSVIAGRCWLRSPRSVASSRQRPPRTGRGPIKDGGP